MSLTIQYVPLQFVHQVWPQVEHYLRDALEQGGVTDYDVGQLKGMVAAGGQELFVAVNENAQVKGAATVQFNNYPNNRVAFVTAIGGRLISNEDTWEQFAELLKTKGATKVAGAARDSIVRLWRRYNFEPKYTVVEVTL